MYITVVRSRGVVIAIAVVGIYVKGIGGAGVRGVQGRDLLRISRVLGVAKPHVIAFSLTCVTKGTIVG